MPGPPNSSEGLRGGSNDNSKMLEEEIPLNDLDPAPDDLNKSSQSEKKPAYYECSDEFGVFDSSADSTESANSANS